MERREVQVEVYPQKLLNFFRKVENFTEALQEPMTPSQRQ